MKSTQELIQSILPLGFRFHPTDEELITQYLKKKVFSSTHFCSSLIAELDLYKFNPWELPDRALFGDDEWFFFTPRDRKYPNGVRPNRATSSGYWKATGTDKAILSSKGSQCIGVKKALVFYRGHPRKGSKTNWMMYEYRLLDQNNHSSRLRGSMRLDDWVLCRIRHRNNTTNKFSHNNPTIISSYLEDDNIDVIKKPNTFNDRDKSYVVEKEVFVDECVPLDLKQQTSCQYFGAPTTYDQPIVQQYCSMTDVLATMRRVLSVGTMDELFMPHNKLFQLSPVDSENSDIFDQS